MFQIHGINISSNTTKTIYTAEELGLDYEYINMDLSKGEHKSPEHMTRHPLGKLPTLTHNGNALFESGAICRYMANVSDLKLYPADDHLKRGRIDQWMDFFSTHSGRWLNAYAFEKVAKVKYGFGEPNKQVEEEAKGFLDQQLPAVDAHLAKAQYFCGDQISIADPFAFAYMEMAEMAELPMDAYPYLQKWYQDFAVRETVKRAKQSLGLA